MERPKSYALTQTIKAPYVMSTGGNNRPPKIVYKTFKQGEIVDGVMKYANGKPAFILVRGIIPIEVTYLKEVTTRDIGVSNATGPTDKPKSDMPLVQHNHPNPKIKYIDSLLIGGVIGALAVHFAEKKGYIAVPDQKHKIYGAIAGGILACYIVYRYQKTKPPIVEPQPKTT